MVIRILPDGSDAAVLIGILLPSDPANPGAILLTSPVSKKEFPEGYRCTLELFSNLNSWDDAKRIVHDMGGDDSGLEALVNAGLIRRMPGEMTPREFIAFFKDLAVVSITGAAATTVHQRYVSLALPGDDGGVAGVAPISPLLYKVLRLSSGDRPLPKVLNKVCLNKPEAVNLIAGELASNLPLLIDRRAVAVIHAR